MASTVSLEQDFWTNKIPLLLLSHFSHFQLCVTPSLGFSRQEHWSGLHFLLQCIKVKSESEIAQSCLTLCDPMDCSLPGSSIHGIFQARVLEWGAIAFTGTLNLISTISYESKFLDHFPESRRYL